MGVPRTLFTLLWALKEPAAREHAIALERIGEFSLFAVVLEDPDGDFRVTEAIQREFMRLDAGTGEKMLFFALVDEPPGWRRTLAERWGEAARSLLETYRVGLKLDDRRWTAQTVATLLGVDARSLPAIVLTADPRSKDTLLLPTSAERVGQQLLRLGGTADRLPSLRRHQGALLEEDLVRELGPMDLLQVHLEESLSAVLYDGLAPGLIGQHRDHARIAVADALAAHWTNVAAIRENGLAASQADVAALIHTELERLAVLVPKQVGRRDAPLGSAGWEGESQRWFALGDHVVAFLRANLEQDYSPAAVCWAKAFERELGLSIGHWLRWEAGILLPPYFDKHQPGVDGRLAVGNGAIDFNRKGKSDLWSAPAMDPMRRAFKEKRSSLPSRLLRAEDLLREWKTIQDHRNHVCHPYAVSSEIASAIRKAVEALGGHGVLGELGAIKTSLRVQGVPWKSASKRV